MPAAQVSTVINLGSSTEEFHDHRPHVERFVFGPLKRRGARIVNMDLKADPGVEIVGDIYDPAIQARARAVGATLLICGNILEHITDPKGFARACASLLPANGQILVTVPHSYPYHTDPIDTYFRPTPQEIADLFEDFRLVDGRIVTDVSYLHDLRAENSMGGLARHFAVHAVKFFLPFRDGLDKWKARYHRYLWLFRPYKVSCALLSRRDR